MEMVEFRSLRHGELDAWFEHCATVFNGGTSDPVLKGLFVNHFYMEPERDLEGILVAVEDSRILSTVKIFYRKAYFYGREISVGGIGGVSTKAEFQGRGLANRLLEDAIVQMRDRKVDLSMLRGTRGIYSRLGWRKTTTYTQVSKAIGSDGLPYRMRPADLNHDVPVLKIIYKAYSIRFNGAFVRDDDAYWKLWVKTERHNLWVLEDTDDKVIGYISFLYEKGCINVREFCTLPQYEDIFEQVVGKLCSMINRKEAEVKFESLIRSGLKADSFETNESNMYLLLSPISAGNLVIAHTEDLVEKLKDAAPAVGNPVSDILFWGIDGF
jgi:predicted N-acetyltransferase YhbS